MPASPSRWTTQDEVFRLRTTVNTDPRVQRALAGLGLGLDDTLVGRAARLRRPLQVVDLTHVADDVHLRTLLENGWLSLVAVPMIRQDRIVGALVVRRRTPGEVDDDTLEFLQTFATQSSLALANAQLYRRLEQQSAELEVASQHKSDFLASMSHELRTPLNAIIGFSEVLLERMFGDLNERQEEYLGDIHASGRHLLALLNDVLDLSKVEAGQMVLERQPLDVEALLASTVALVRERAHRHGLTVEATVAEPGLTVQADELRLRQVVLNLVTNAVKFTPDGGRVDVRAERRGDEVAVTVTDTGVGVPEADRARIFESFQQGERSPGTQEGTGLGLTLSRRIVELHGGRMWLDSEVGRGSTFGFTVPVAPTADDAGWPPAGGVPEGAVLVVEDDARSASLMTALLEGQGLTVDVATTGEQALERLLAGRPSAVVLDIRLPGIDGWDVLRQVKGDAETADIPVIIVSILDERGQGLALGADDYLVKPVGRELLVAALERTGVLTGRRGQRVLVVDADDADADDVVGELRRAGWTVERAGSVSEARAAVARQAPDIVLLDLLTGADGVPASAERAWSEVLGDVPVVGIAPAGAGQWRLVAEHLTPAEADWSRTDGRPCCWAVPWPGLARGDPMAAESVLVVEDNERNLKLVRTVLEHAGFEVHAAGTAEDGVAAAVTRPPAAVLMDLQLPGRDGYWALQALRENPSTRGVPVLAVTALAMTADRRRVEQAGFDGYVEKPISVRELPGQVRDVIDRCRGRS